VYTWGWNRTSSLTYADYYMYKRILRLPQLTSDGEQLSLDQWATSDHVYRFVRGSKGCVHTGASSLIISALVHYIWIYTGSTRLDQNCFPKLASHLASHTGIDRDGIGYRTRTHSRPCIINKSLLVHIWFGIYQHIEYVFAQDLMELTTNQRAIKSPSDMLIRRGESLGV
jgi:hypothetical protein